MGAGLHEVDVENSEPFRQSSMSDRGYVSPVGSAYVSPPPSQGAVHTAEERGRNVFLVPFFVAANVVVLIGTMYYNNCPKKSQHCALPWLRRFSFQPLGENPLFGPSELSLKKMGGLMRNLVTDDGQQGWRLVSCMWLHAGVLHLLANMFALVLLGVRLEKEFGFLKVTVVYLIAGFGGSLMSALFIENEITVGASAPVFGLLGASVSELITNSTIYANKCLALTSLAVIVLLNLGFGLLPNVDNFAHIGGFVGGFLLGFVVLVKPQYEWANVRYLKPANRDPGDRRVKSKHTISQYALRVIAAILLVLLYAAATVALFSGVNANKKCRWCHYLSCVNTSRGKCNHH